MVCKCTYKKIKRRYDSSFIYFLTAMFNVYSLSVLYLFSSSWCNE